MNHDAPDAGRSQPACSSRLAARVWLVALTALLALGAAFSAHAQSAGDPPSRAARLSEVVGPVWMYNPDSDEWITVARNRPLTTGDRIATDNGARAEITLGSTTLRLDAGSELEIARLDDTHFSLRLRGGTLAVRVRNPQSLAEFELNTDEGRFRAQTVGRYRFDRFDQTSDVTVFAGQAIFEARNTALPVTTGQHAQFWVDAAGVPQYAMVPPARDAFAAWNDDRDRAEDRALAATRYVSPEMTGADDLDRYGQWQQTPEYGPLWVPSSVPVDWAPYRTGHWAWVRPWGWTWVDDAAWGFAPFHYGRWVYHRNAWCWAPGTYIARPVYAPALVAWVGGPSVGVSITVGGAAPVGWFPLAPHEVYVPSYRSSPRYLREVNITHVTNITTITNIVNNRNGEGDRRDFANRKFAHAVTFVPAEVMTHREPVAPAAARLRNDPQLRALVSNERSAPVLSAPPVSAPPPLPRSAQGRTPPRPPFEGRAPGFATGRPEAPARAEGARPEGARPEGARPDGGRPDGGRSNLARPPVAGSVASPAAVAPPAAAVVPPRAAGPSPVQRGGPPTEATARPGAPGRELRTPNEGGAELRRDGRPAVTAPAPNGAAREVAPVPMPDRSVPPRTVPPRTVPPRTVEAPRAVEAPRQAPPAAEAPRRAEPPHRVEAPRPGEPRPPAPKPEAAAPRAPEPRPAEAQAPAGEGRMTRPEAPRGRGDERRDDKGERQR